MNLQDTIRRILIEEIEKDLSPILENLLNKMLVNENRDIICGVKVKHPSNRTKLPYNMYDHEHYRVDITFKGRDKSIYPVPIALQNKYDSLIDDAWNIVYDFTGHPVDIFYKYFKDCE
jgi:hypothetical protein